MRPTFVWLLLFGSALLACANPDGFGLGWMIEDLGGHPAAFHTGAQPRTAAIVYLVPDAGVAVALLSNLEGAVLHPLARALAKAVVEGKE
jgi:hypothetical protein